MMDERELGTNLSVSALGLGCMGMSEFYGAADDNESVQTLLEALASGITFFDTADMYGMGHNERLLGKAFAGKRAEIVIATKFGIVRDGLPGSSGRTINGRPDYVHAACNASLKRLGTDYIDLYYQHRVDPDIPIEDTVGAMAELVKEGKVRYLGLSEPSAEQLRRAQAVHPIAAVQSEYSLFTRDVESEVLPTCRALGVGFVPYSPLGRGFLSGRFRNKEAFSTADFRSTLPRFQAENFAANLRLVDALERLALEKEATAAQLALAWLLAQGQDIVPIPGTKQRARLRENILAIRLELDTNDLQRIAAALPEKAIVGTRYSEGELQELRRVQEG